MSLKKYQGLACIELTVAENTGEFRAGTVIQVPVTDLIAYAQNQGFTHLRLLRRRSLYVKETVSQIDQLVRAACASPAAGAPTGSLKATVAAAAATVAAKAATAQSGRKTSRQAAA